jgi:ArsR family transcriptional regulator
VLGASPSLISHQLRVLRDLDLVRHRREGRATFYALDDEHVRRLFEEGLKRAREAAPRREAGRRGPAHV